LDEAFTRFEKLVFTEIQYLVDTNTVLPCSIFLSRYEIEDILAFTRG